LLGYSIVWILFALVISVSQIGLLYLDAVDMMDRNSRASRVQVFLDKVL
jgi:hypothetical protein